MNSDALFGMALGLQTQWKMKEVVFEQADKGGKALHLHIGFTTGAKFADETGVLCEAFAMALIELGMLVSRVAHMLGVSGQRIWTLFSYRIAKVRQADRINSVTRLGLDDPLFRCASSHVSN